MSDDESIVVIEDGVGESKYKRINSRGYRYKKDKTIVTNRNFIGCIGRINSDDSLTILSIEDQALEENTMHQIEEFIFPDQIIDEIKNKIAVVAMDAAMVGEYLATHWIVSMKQNEVEIAGGLVSSR